MGWLPSCFIAGYIGHFDTLPDLGRDTQPSLKANSSESPQDFLIRPAGDLPLAVRIYLCEGKRKGSGVDFFAGAEQATGQSAKFSPPSEGITHATNGRISACLRKDVACVSRRGCGRAGFAGKRSQLCVSLAGRVSTASAVSLLVGRLCGWRRGRSGGRIRTGGSSADGRRPHI
jgi:hypothetical protein